MSQQRPDRRTVWAWCLYDFGNSSFAVLFPALYGVYYAGTVVGEGTEGDWWWGLTVSCSMLAVALSSPLLGGIADHTGLRKRMLAVYTGVGVAAVLCIMGIEPGMVFAGFLVGMIANFAFEGGIVFYNAYLPIIATPATSGRISAMGFAVGYVGSLVALGFAVLLNLLHWGQAIWIAVGVQWLMFSLPAFRYLPADRPTGVSLGRAARRGVRQTVETIKEVWGRRNLRVFLLSYFLYMDGVITVVNFAGRYASRTLGYTTTEIVGLIATVQVTALLGSLIMARPTDRLGPRWVVRLLLMWWTLVVVVAFFAETKMLFAVVGVLAGLGLGSIQAASRAFMARLIPRGRETEFFGFYALCGKSGAIAGPFIFGALATTFDDQRPAVLAVAAFYAAGWLLLRNVNDDPVE